MSGRLNWEASRRDCEEACVDREPKAGCGASGEENPGMGGERKQETGRGMGGEMSLAMGDVMEPKTGRGMSGEVGLVMDDEWERKVCRRKSREGSGESVDRHTASRCRTRIHACCW